MLTWPEVADAAPAVEVAPCAVPLALRGKSKEVKPDGAASLLSAMLGSVALSKAEKKDETAPPVTWCRDATSVPIGAVYRANGATDSYLIALSDAGRGVLVHPDAARALLAKDKDRDPAWSVQFVELGRTVHFASRDRLPPPGQAIEIFRAGRALSAASTWGESKMEINTDALK